MSHKERLLLIDKTNKEIPISRQSKLLGVSRSSIYYKPLMDRYNLTLMRLIDEQYTRTPFYGSRKMTVFLNRNGHYVNRKRVQRLMRQMGIEAIYPKRNLSRSNPEHKIYPYLLRDLRIDRPNQVWCADITYIRLQRGWIYLVAIMDWFSRYVLSWEVSTSLETDFCLTALDKALSAGRPEIFNTDQGSQFTSNLFTKKLKDRSILISMDGRGRALDNVFIERLWRSLKYEEVYLRDYHSVSEGKHYLKEYMIFYNHERFHQSLGYQTPAEVHFQRSKWHMSPADL